LETAQKARILGRCSLFRSLAPDDLLSLAKRTECRKYAAGQDICEEGARPLALHVLVAGSVKLVHSHPDGSSQIVGLRGPIWALELSAILDGAPFLTTAQASTTCATLSIARPVFLSVLAAYPEARSLAIEQLASEMRERDIVATSALLGSAKERVACALLRLARQFGVPEQGGVAIRERVTRQDIASTTGVALETSVRIMSGYERDGLIKTAAQRVLITDLEALRQVAGCDACLLQCQVYERALPVRTANGNGASVPLAATVRENGNGTKSLAARDGASVVTDVS
jgi:CRP-like cAMP-binding protein